MVKEKHEKRVRGDISTPEKLHKDYLAMLEFYELPILEHEKLIDKPKKEK